MSSTRTHSNHKSKLAQRREWTQEFVLIALGMCMCAAQRLVMSKNIAPYNF